MTTQRKMPQFEVSSDPRPKKHKSTFFIFFVCFNAAIAAFFSGYALVYISTFQDFKTIIEIYGIQIGGQDTTESLITGCVPIGAMIGALSTSVLLNRLSRRNCFLFTNFLVIVGHGICLIKVGAMILIGRLIFGMCIGIFFAIVPLYINEFTPLELKNFGTLNQVFIASAQSLTFLLYYLLTGPFGMTDESSYIYVSNFCLITIIIQSVVFLFIFPYETPKYWLQKREIQKCKELLGIIYQVQWVQQAYEELTATQQKDKQQDMNQSVLQAANENRQSGHQPLKQKQHTQMPKIAVFLALHLSLIQPFMGINPVVIYGGKILTDVLPNLNKIIPIFTNLLPAITASFTTELMRKYGRKTLLQLGALTLIIPLGMMCVGFSIFPYSQSMAPKIMIVMSLFLYMAAFGLTIGSIVWLIIPELVEPHVIPYSTMTNLIGGTIIIMLFPIASVQFGNMAYSFGFFVFWGLMSLLINHRYLVQTKDKTRKQIYEELQIVQNKSHKF